MDVLRHVEIVRESYLELFRKAIREARQAGQFLASEVGVEMAQPDTGKPSVFRIDLVQGQKDSPAIVMVANGALEEGPLIGALPRETIEVAVHPFLWEACRIWFRLPEPHWQPLEQWFKEWFADQERPAGPEGAPDDVALAGAVHHMTDPIAEGGGYLLEVDFGSAPVRAFTDLLDALAGMGATDVRVGLSDSADIDPVVAAELAQPNPPLTPERFTRLVAQLLKDLDEIEDVESPAPLVLQIKSRGEKEASLSNLHNLWLLIGRTSPEKRPREVARFLRGHRESQQFIESGAKPDLASLRPVIKPSGFIEHVQEMGRRAQAAGKKPAQALSLVCTRLVGDLWIACVWDRPNGMQFVTAGEPDEFGLSREETLQRALKNYLDGHPEPQIARQDGVTTVRTHDNYDATLLLDDGFWEKLRPTLPGALLACAPTRDVILVSSTGSPGGEAGLRRLARQYAESQNHAISTTVLRREKNVWLVHGKEVTTQEISEAQEAKRAWWKFW